MRKKDVIKLAVSLLICQLAGLVGSFFTAPSIPVWYASLQKPSFNPPDEVFSPVWITLYVLMGISLYLIWRKPVKERGVKIALFYFFVQLALNTLWSILFFGLKSPFLAFIEIILLWITIFLTIMKSYKVTKWAGILLVPYILWVSFAVVLNFFLWNLNR